MAGQSDGSIIIDTELDSEGFKAGSGRMQKAIQSLSDSVNRLEPTFQKAMSGSASALSALDGKMPIIREQIDNLREQLNQFGSATVSTQAYENIENQINSTEKALKKLYERQEKMKATGVKENSRQWQSLEYDIQKAEEKLQHFLETKKTLEATGLAFTLGSDSEQYEQMDAALSGIAEKISSMADEAERVKAAMADATPETEEISSETEEASQHSSRLGSFFRAAARAAGETAKWAGGLLVRGIKASASHMAKLLSHSKSLNGQFKGLVSGAKRFGMSILGVRSVYMLFRKAVSAYMAENEQLSQTLSACWTSLGNVLGPIITKVINLVAQAVAYVTSFLNLFGALGKGTSTAIDKAGKKASGAAKELKRQLASFDELNILSDNKSDSGSEDKKTELPEVTLPDWAKLLADQLKSGQWEAAAITITDQLNNLVNSVDWEELGKKLGYYLNGVLTFLATAIKNFDWINLGSKLGEMLNGIITSVDWRNLGVLFAAKLAILLQLLTSLFETLDGAAVGWAIYDFLMGAITAVDWVSLTGRLSKAVSDFIQAINFSALGGALTTGILTILQSLNAAITNFDWRGLGAKISYFLNAIDWAGIIGEIVSFVSNTLRSALELLLGFAETLDWEKLGYDLYDSLVSIVTNIDWKGIITTAFELLGAAVGGISSLVATFALDVWELLKKGFEKTKNYFEKYIKEAGGEVADGLFYGIVDAFKNVGNWIVKNIFNPFIEGFKSAFGIHSPSTKMAEMGGFLIDGLKNGITEAWSSITQFFSKALPEIGKTINTAWTNIKTKTSTTWNNIKSSLSNTVSSISTNVSSKFSSMASTISGKVSSIKSTISSGFENARSNIVNKMKSAAQTISNQNWRSIGSNICTGIANGINAGWTWLHNTVSNLASNLLNAAKNVLGIHSPSALFRDEVGLNIGYGIGEGVEDSEPSILKSVTGVADAIAEEFNAGEYSMGGIVPAGEVDIALASFTDKITNSFTMMLDGLQQIADSVSFRIPDVTNSVVPYKTLSASGAGGNDLSTTIDSSNEELISVIIQTVTNSTAAVVRAIEENSGTTVNLDKDSLTSTVIEEINRRTRMMGKSPLLR